MYSEGGVGLPAHSLFCHVDWKQHLRGRGARSFVIFCLISSVLCFFLVTDMIGLPRGTFEHWAQIFISKNKNKEFQPIPLDGDAHYSQVGCSHTTSMCSVDKCGPAPMHFASVLHLEPNTTFPNLAILIPSIKLPMFISFVFLTICALSSIIKLVSLLN